MNNKEKDLETSWERFETKTKILVVSGVIVLGFAVYTLIKINRK